MNYPYSSLIQVYHWLVYRGPLTAYGLADQIGANRRTTSRRLNQLRSMGYVRPAGWGGPAGRAVVWRAVDLADVPAPKSVPLCR